MTTHVVVIGRVSVCQGHLYSSDQATEMLEARVKEQDENILRVARIASVQKNLKAYELRAHNISSYNSLPFLIAPTFS